MQLANLIVITVTPIARRRDLYIGRLDGGATLKRPSKQPFLDGARRLLELGYDPSTMLVMRHTGSDTDCLTAQIGAAARLRVKEDRGGPRFVTSDPISRRVEALARAKAKRVAGVARSNGIEPSVRPGATVVLVPPSG
jgi:hypothetical protein